MIGEYKKFDTGLYDAHNDAAISRAIKYINSMGTELRARQNPDMYAPDIIVHRAGDLGPFYVEVEVCVKWRPDQDWFPWDTVSLPERKEKYLDLEYPIEFWRMRSDLQMTAIVPDYVIDRKAHRVEVPNKEIRTGEYFLRIPVDLCIITEL